MSSRSLRVLSLALLLALACASPFVAAAKSAHRHHSHHKSTPAHKRVYHHQGETLAKPEHFLDGVDLERFLMPEEQLEATQAPQLKTTTPGAFQVGAGTADVTGQIAEIGFMGYAVPGQTGSGIQMRQRARAFIFVDDNAGSKTHGNRVVYVSLDMCMGFQMVKLAVVEALQAKFGPDLYSHANVLLSGTHTHSTPGGVGGTALVDITTFGFSQENFDAAVKGIVNAISRAHDNIEPATVKINVGQCDGCNINRSPSAYLLDPERDQYANNTDHEMTVLRITAKSGRELGMVSFFAVHGTSLNNTNTLVSGDNKGYASLKFEEHINPPGTLPGKGSFVAAFGQSNLGDVSPNTKGPHCPDGTPCDFNTSTCGGKTEGCIAPGPGVDMVDSQRIIGQMQLDAALALWETASVELSNAGVDSRWEYVDMQNATVNAKFTSTGKNETTCRAAMGYSFAAGTIDGPGDFDFTQGTKSPNPFWAFISSFLATPTAEDIACQAPKPILLPVGQIGPIEWVPYILPEQIFRVGDLWILGVPGEFTTMSGRRLRNMVKQQLQAAGQWTDSSHVVIAGLSNSYSHYITTYEEYQQQRYEGASTLYGPHTLALHMQNFAGLVDAIVSGTPAPVGPLPIDMRNKTFNFITPVAWDSPPKGKAFGDVNVDVQPSYKIGQMVNVSFWGASPRNDLQTESSYLFVQRQQPDQTWITVAVDGNWETRFHWKRAGIDQSVCTVEWDIPATAEPGTYRIQTQGVSKAPVTGVYTPYMGTSSTFTVTA